LPTYCPTVDGSGAIVGNGNGALEASIPFVNYGVTTNCCLGLACSQTHTQHYCQAKRFFAKRMFFRSLHVKSPIMVLLEKGR
jgi:hypothetical protein